MQLHYELTDLKDIDFMALLPIILPLFVVGMLLVLVALIDLYRNKERRTNVLMWTLIILFANTLGPILYFVMGRKENKRA